MHGPQLDSSPGDGTVEGDHLDAQPVDKPVDVIATLLAQCVHQDLRIRTGGHRQIVVSLRRFAELDNRPLVMRIGRAEERDYGARV